MTTTIATADGKGQWALTLPYASPPLSLNRHMHHMKEAAERRQIKQDVGWLARAAKLPRGLHRVHVVLVWRPKQIRRRDSDNPSPTLKPAIDALVQYGLVVDDTVAHVSSSVEIRERAEEGKHGMWLVIIDASGAPLSLLVDNSLLR